MKKKKYTNETLFDTIVSILKEKGLYPEGLDYDLAEQRTICDMKTYEWTCKGDLAFGGNEGIYLDIYAVGDLGDGNKKVRLGVFKTLGESREDFYMMAKLQADFIWETSVFVNAHMDDFTWTGYDLDYYNGDKKIISVTVGDEKSAKMSMYRKSLYYEFDHIIMTDNATGKQKRIERDEVPEDWRHIQKSSSGTIITNRMWNGR